MQCFLHLLRNTFRDPRNSGGLNLGAILLFPYYNSALEIQQARMVKGFVIKLCSYPNILTTVERGGLWASIMRGMQIP